MLQIAAHLRRLLQPGDVLREALHFEDAALGLEIQQRRGIAVLAEFLCGKECAIGEIAAGVLWMNDRDDLRLQCVADGIEEIPQRRVAGGFRDADAGDFVEFLEVVRNGVGHRCGMRAGFRACGNL